MSPAVRSDRMRSSDALAWNLGRDPVLRATMVGVARLDRPPDWEVLRERVERLSRSEPRMRQLVRTIPLHRTPLWRPDPSFDLDFHLRRSVLPADGEDWPQVLQFVHAEMMAEFDPARPLWRFTLIEGLTDGGAVLVCAVHHALADGLGALASALVDPGLSGAGPPVAPVPRASLLRDVFDAVRDDVEVAQEITKGVWLRIPATTVAAAAHPLRAMSAARAAVASTARMVAPIGRPASGEFGDRRSRRVVETLLVPQAHLAASARVSGVHLNDAFLAAVTDGVRRYHLAVGSPLETIRVTVPVSLRDPTDSAASNRITLLRMRFPAQIVEPGRRMRRVAAISGQWRHEPALAWNDAIAAVLNLLPRGYLGQVFERVEVLASDVPGPPGPFRLEGAEVTALFPFGPTLGAAANITLLTYGGTCHVGVVVDPDAVSEPDLFVACLTEGFDDVVQVGRGRSASRSRAR